MDEDVGAKAPVTRLRRRLSVEADDVKSSSGSTTPTKKRGGRLAAKPQLDLIVEAIENIPKRSTRKTAAKDISIDTGDEVPVTPSRRSARIRSNTSIVSETTQSYDSPRAKRAARRTSQAGSDNETPLTPARQTRRTRKDSTSSIDKQDDITIGNKVIEVTEVILEEMESSDDLVQNNTIVRKSPRLSQKNKNKMTNSTTPEDKSKEHGVKDDKVMDYPINNDTTKTSAEIIQSSEPVVDEPLNVDMPNDMITEIKNIDQSNFSSDNSSDKLIIDLDRKPKKIYSVMNKSTSALEDSNNSKNKRLRTNSWSISLTNKKDDKFYSDNEVTKKKRNNNSLSLFDMGSGDGVYNTNPKLSKNKPNKVDKENENHLNLSNTNENDKFITAATNESINKSIKHNKPSTEASKTISKFDGNNEETSQSSQISPDLNSVTKLLQKAPSDNLQPEVVIEDSDSNTGSIGNIKQDKQCDGEDQCVPVVVQHIQMEKKDLVNSNDSYEPMDVDETIPQNISITDFSKNKSLSNLEEHVSKQNVSIYSSTEKVNCNEKSNKSQRKSSVTDSESQNLEKSSNENKSTLILSQIKDTSSNEFNAVSKSPKDTITNEQQCQSTIIPDTTQDKEKHNKNLSLNYLTSTPLQQKCNKNIGMQIDTSIISPKNCNKKETNEPRSASNKSGNSVYKPALSDDKKNNKSLKEKSQVNDEQETESSAHETSNEQSNLINDEAEEASIYYESGDSQDYEERQYEKDNEILDKGETLDTDDDYSDDTDYEKDSFIVSSNEEDQELLSGSGDDLSMSDNELSMSAKSKKKFNDRKIKEQKKASQEMYQARHKLNHSDRSSKSDKSKTKKNKRQRIDSSSSNSDQEIEEQPKKNNRLRIDSSQDISISKSDADESVSKKKKKSKRLTESSSNAMNENEITILNESIDEKINPLATLVKQEPKTPQKDLNISTVLITDNLEEVKIDENVSMIKSNETSDPLQATVANEESDSSSSGNEEIIGNYDLMLNELNCKQIKSKDISLNLDKKEKTVNEPIFDQLNLTNIKKRQKKLKVNTYVDANAIKLSEDVQALDKPTINSDEEAASDSIDLRLLFSEDSNESDFNDKNQNKGNTDIQLPDFIPLKKTEAQTNIRVSMDITSENNDTSVQNLSNSSKKKKKKRESSQYILREMTNNEEKTDDINFFVDTAGTRFDVSNDTSLSTSAKKKKNKDNSIICNVAEETPAEILYSSEKKKRKSKQSLNNTNSDAETYAKFQAVEIPIGNTVTTSEKKLKKNKKGMSLNNSHSELEIQIATGANSASFIIDTVGMQLESSAPIDTSLSLANSGKKKKTNKSHNFAEELPVDISYSSEKKNKKSKQSLENTQTEAEIDVVKLGELENTETSSGKKKKKNKKDKLSLNNTHNELEVKSSEIGDIESDEAPMEISYTSDKKNKKAKLSMDNNSSQINIETQMSSTVSEDAAPLETSYRSDKKKHKKMSQSQDTIDTEIEQSVPNTSLGSAKKHKKKSNQNKSADMNDLHFKEYTDVQEEKHVVTNSKKRKREASANSLNEVVPTEDKLIASQSSKSLNESLTVSSKKKKQKIGCLTGQEPDSLIVNSLTNQEPEQIGGKKSKKHVHNEENNELIKQEPIKKNSNKKRKERDDDDPVKVSKVFKQNSLDKIHVPRLPSHVLNQLDDKPKPVIVEKKKHQAISTSNFSVEIARIRRNKPSNYLEESVYLNDSPVVKKQKKSLKKPKVLPFVPTASTSDSGFTTNFRINLLSRDTDIAQSNDVINFKSDLLQQHKQKRFDTFGKYKAKNRNHNKIDKF